LKRLERVRNIFIKNQAHEQYPLKQGLKQEVDNSAGAAGAKLMSNIH
jgi:hypothetical protein